MSLSLENGLLESILLIEIGIAIEIETENNNCAKIFDPAIDFETDISGAIDT